MSEELEMELNAIIVKSVEDLRVRLIKCAKKYQLRAYKDGVSSMKPKKEDKKPVIVSPKRRSSGNRNDSDSD